MTLSTFAWVLGTVELLIGLPLLVSPARSSQWLIRLIREDLVYRLVGAVFLVICVLPLAEGASVDWSLAGLMRLVAWLGAVKSLVICWRPGWHAAVAERCLPVAVVARATGVLATAFGVFLFWAGSALL